MGPGPQWPRFWGYPLPSRSVVVVYVGTYLGANCATLGRKTEKTLAGIVGGVAHMFVDMYPPFVLRALRGAAAAAAAVS